MLVLDYMIHYFYDPPPQLIKQVECFIEQHNYILHSLYQLPTYVFCIENIK